MKTVPTRPSQLVDLEIYYRLESDIVTSNRNEVIGGG